MSSATIPASAFLRAMILATTMLATTLYATTMTIANVALPQMQGALSATADQIAWVVTFNIVATAIATPPTGWLAARLGRRRLMLLSIGGFTAASIMCGIATSLQEVVLYRVLQGLFGAPLVPLSQAITLDTYPREAHGRVTAIWGMGVILGPILGPTVGGYMTEMFNWRWVFFIIVPFGVLALVGTLAFIHDVVKPKAARLDWTGFIALSAALAALQLMLDRGGRLDWFESPEIVIEACIAVLGFYVFVVHSLTARNPFLDPRVLLDRNFTVGILLVTLFGILNFTPMVLIPPMLKTLAGYPDDLIGLLLAARGMGTMAGNVLAMFLTRADPRWSLALGLLCQGAAGWGMTRFDVNVGVTEIVTTSLVQGFGVGIMWVPLTVVTFATLPQERRTEGTAIFHLLRNIGSSISISVGVSVMLHSAKVNYATMAESVSGLAPTLRLPGTLGAWSLDSPGGLAALSAEMARQAALIGYTNAFLLFAVAAFIGIPVLLLVQDPRRHRGADPDR